MEQEKTRERNERNVKAYNNVCYPCYLCYPTQRTRIAPSSLGLKKVTHNFFYVLPCVTFLCYLSFLVCGHPISSLPSARFGRKVSALSR